MELDIGKAKATKPLDGFIEGAVEATHVCKCYLEGLELACSLKASICRLEFEPCARSQSTVLTLFRLSRVRICGRLS
jgi:hypothetical protein